LERSGAGDDEEERTLRMPAPVAGPPAKQLPGPEGGPDATEPLPIYSMQDADTKPTAVPNRQVPPGMAAPRKPATGEPPAARPARTSPKSSRSGPTSPQRPADPLAVYPLRLAADLPPAGARTGDDEGSLPGAWVASTLFVLLLLAGLLLAIWAFAGPFVTARSVVGPPARHGASLMIDRPVVPLSDGSA